MSGYSQDNSASSGGSGSGSGLTEEARREFLLITITFITNSSLGAGIGPHSRRRDFVRAPPVLTQGNYNIIFKLFCVFISVL